MDIFEENSALDASILYILSSYLLLHYSLVGLTFRQNEIIVFGFCDFVYLGFAVAWRIRSRVVLMLTLWAVVVIQFFDFIISLKIWLPQEVGPHVLVQIRLLSEREVAIELPGVRALERPLFRVDP